MAMPKSAEEEVFNAARRIDAPDARRAYVERECGGDQGLKDRIEALLRVYDQERSFLRSPVEGMRVTEDRPPGERFGAVIGPYRLLEQIGEGGFGVVYMAEQQHPVRRKVALKVLKPGMDTRQVVARFEAERQALALMDHPNIAKVLDGGETASGRPYFVMDLVRGIPVTEFCDQNHLPVRPRLELFVTICQAVQHAHQKGIIHRDLKPTNVLVTMHDSTPSPFPLPQGGEGGVRGVVRIIDFGIAKALGQKLTEKTLFTSFAQMVGTPLYMSPEQAEMSGLDIDTRTDIFSLGVLLYELLTGTTPFDRERLNTVPFDELRRIIREEEPARPSARITTIGPAAATMSTNRQSDPKRLSRLFRGELDWIVMKCLEKDRTRRYQTANGLARDIQRYLNEEPVEACPPSAGYRLKKFARRNKGSLAVAAGVFLAVTVTAGSIGWAVRDRAARQAEIEQTEIARRAKVEGQVRDSLSMARALIAENNLASAREKLAQARARLGDDSSALDGLASEVEANAAELDRFQRFLALIDRAHQAETAPPPGLMLAAEAPNGTPGKPVPPATWGRRPTAAVPFLHEALTCYDVLKSDVGINNLGGGFLDRQQVEQIRRFVYEELLWLADDLIRRRREHESEKSLSPEAAARQALVYLEKAESAHAPTQALHALRARCRTILGEDAAAQADSQRANHTPATIAFDHFLRGQAAYDAKQLQEGVQAFEAALSVEPTHYWSLMRLGYCLSDLGRGPEDSAEAARIFTGCILNRPEHAHAYFCRAKTYYDRGRYVEAVTDDSKAIELDPQHTLAWMGRGISQFKLGRFDEAVADFSRAIELDPMYASPWYNRGNAHRKLSREDLALTDYSKAIELDPTFAAAWYNRGNAHSKLGREDMALTDFSKAVELDPKFMQAWYNRANAHSKLGREDMALTDYSKAIELDPTFAQAWYSRGNAHRKLRQADKAVDDYTKAIELDTNFKLAWYNRGLAHNSLGQPEKALADFTRAIELDPMDARSWCQRGRAYNRLGQAQKAVDDHTKAIEIDPKYVNALISRGSAYDILGHPEKAFDDFSRAIELDPSDPIPWSNRGLVNVALGREHKAIADFSKAIELDPKYARAWSSRGHAYSSLEEPGKAVADCSKAIELDPKYANAWSNRGVAYIRLGRPDKAVADCSKAVELAPSVGNHWKVLGVAQYRAGDWNAAVAALSKSRELRQGGDAIDQLFLAMAHWKLGNRDEARKAYEEAIPWLDKNQEALEKDRIHAKELRRFRAEAEELLELKKK